MLKQFGKLKKFYNSSDGARWGRDFMPDMEKPIKQIISSCKLLKQDFIVELGCGKGALKEIHPNYIGIDVSMFALRKYLTGKKVIQADIQNLPLKDKSIDFIISIAAIEHVPNPEKVFSEIDRVLKKERIAYIFPSWFCRPWAAKGLPIKKYLGLSFIDKIRKFLIPLRNHIIYRSMSVIPKRIFREISYFLSTKPLPFHYKKLRPNLDKYIYTDCDAFSSMDPHMAIMYYLSRSYKVLSGGGRFLKRIFYQHKPVVVRKKR